MTLQKKLQKTHETIAELSIGSEKVKHYYHMRMDAPFVVWAEDGPDDYFNADGLHAEWTAHATLDYFTKEEYDPVFDEIEQMLTRLFGSRWRWRSTQYEDATELIHHEWEFVICG